MTLEFPWVQLVFYWGGGQHPINLRFRGRGPVFGPVWARIRAPRANLLQNTVVKSKTHRFQTDFWVPVIGVLKSGDKHQRQISTSPLPFQTRLEKSSPKMMSTAQNMVLLRPGLGLREVPTGLQYCLLPGPHWFLLISFRNTDGALKNQFLPHPVVTC